MAVFNTRKAILPFCIAYKEVLNPIKPTPSVLNKLQHKETIYRYQYVNDILKKDLCG